VWTRPKTRAGTRLIPLVPALVDILRQLDRDGPLVFHLDGKPISQEVDQRAWKDLLIAANVPHAPQHSIRHSTATLLLEAGVDAHIVQSVIGHSDILTTHGYQHVSLDLARQAWGSLAAIMPLSE
jgi:integrase